MGYQDDVQAGEGYYAQAQNAGNGSLYDTANLGVAIAKGVAPGTMQQILAISAQIAAGYATGAGAAAAIASLAGVAAAGVPIFGAAVGVTMAVFAALVSLFGAHGVTGEFIPLAQQYADQVVYRVINTKPSQTGTECLLANYFADQAVLANPTQGFGYGGNTPGYQTAAEQTAVHAQDAAMKLQQIATAFGETGALVATPVPGTPFVGTSLDKAKSPLTARALQRWSDWGLPSTVPTPLAADTGSLVNLCQWDPRPYVIANNGDPEDALQLLFAQRWAFDAGNRDAKAQGFATLPASAAAQIAAGIATMQRQVQQAHSEAQQTALGGLNVTGLARAVTLARLEAWTKFFLGKGPAPA